jgi:adenylate cyclase
MDRDSNLPRTQGFGHWLAGEARAGARLDALFDAYCRELLARGLAIWRSTLGLEILHPETSGKLLTWQAGNLMSRQSERAGMPTNPGYLNSPTRVVDDTNRPFRQRLEGVAPEFPLLADLKAEGVTDYVMYPLPFLDTTRTAVLSYATTEPGGFTDGDLGELETASDLLSPYAERVVLRRIAIDLLDTYVGHQAGERIFAGSVERGAVEALTAAIWMADLRGFTRMSDGLPRETVIALLDDWFDCLSAAIEDHSGEILKFMGDGLLAIFPAGEDHAAGCERALDAALAAHRGVAALNRSRGEAGEPPFSFGLALHLGEVAYGNVGGRRRLDFTVIGPAINHASRLQELTKSLNRSLLISGAVARATRRPLVSLGRHHLRDVAEPHEVFTLPGIPSPLAGEG